MARRKGQAQVFEQVLLFAIGVMIFIVCFASFSAYQSYFVDAGNTDQLIQIRDYIAYAIVKASEGWNTTDSYITLEVPKTIGDEMYRVKLWPKGLTITMLPSMRSNFTELYGINLTTELIESEVPSSYGRIVLYKNGNKIILT